jgi:acyl dehydratase
MRIDLSAVGHATAAIGFRYDWQKVALYALAVGATRDELEYVCEARGPRVLPTFAACVTYEAVVACIQRVGGDPNAIVHGAQSIRVVGALPRAGELTTVARIEAIYDLDAMAEVVVTTRTTADGAPICETTWSLLHRGSGGFGGPRSPTAHAPEIPDRDPDFVIDQRTSPEQALLYSVAADANPLHVDPELAARAGFSAPPLQGLCTLGFAVRLAIGRALGGDPKRVRAVHARFRKPVFPGDTICVEGWSESGSIVMSVHTRESPHAVLSGAWLELT